MANWCSTSYYFEGNKEEIADLYQKLSSLDQAEESLVENDFGTNWLGNVVHLFGGNWEEIHCRGEFHTLQLENECLISFSTETAWSDMDDVWKYIQSKYNSLKYFYSAEESGCEYYFTNDKEGKYFPERFIIESGVYETEYRKTLEETLSVVSERLGATFTTKEEMGKALEAFNEASDDDYLYVNEIEVAEEIEEETEIINQ